MIPIFVAVLTPFEQKYLKNFLARMAIYFESKSPTSNPFFAGNLNKNYCIL
jgi:hypothetical protein